MHLRPLGHLSKVLKQGKFNETSLFVQEGSSVTVNAFFRAIAFCRTFRAERGEGSANLLPERDKQLIQRYPVFLGHYGFKRLHAFLRRACVYPAEPVADLVDMAVDTDCRYAETEVESEIRCLHSHAGQREELLCRTGNTSVKPCDDFLCDFLELGCLPYIEAAGIDGFLYVLFRCSVKGIYVRSHGKQPL